MSMISIVDEREKHDIQFWEVADTNVVEFKGEFYLLVIDENGLPNGDAVRITDGKFFHFNDTDIVRQNFATKLVICD